MSLPMCSAEQPFLDPHILEFCKNLLFASHYKQCTNASELLQKVVALKCIQDNGMMLHLQSILYPQFQPSTSTSDPSDPSDDVMEVDEEEEDVEVVVDDDEPPRPISSHGGPIFFNSMTVVIENLQKEGVDSQVSESIALDRLCSPSANPLSFMGGIVINGKKLGKVDSEKLQFVKRLLKKMHNHEKFNRDGAPYQYDVKSALKYSEKLHEQIPPLHLITPSYIAHEQSITLTAMARFMAMHECIENCSLRVMFPGSTAFLEERAYYSSVFWTYREAFKKFYYPEMPPPLPSAFQLTPNEKSILRRYWNAGNRHVSVTEATLLSQRCPSLAPYQIYGFFDRRRRREYSQYCNTKSIETLTRDSTLLLKRYHETKKGFDRDEEEEDLEEESEEVLTFSEAAQLSLMWDYGFQKPSRNECELWAACLGISSAQQTHAYFEDRRYREESESKRTISKSKRNRQKAQLLEKLKKVKDLEKSEKNNDNEPSFSGTFQKN